MKKIFLGALIGLSMCVSVNGSTVSSWNDLMIGTQRAYTITSQNGYETILIISGMITYKEERCDYRTLSAGQTYIISGVGSDGIIDLDIELYGENGNLVTKDVKNDRLPIVTYTPEITQMFKIKAIAYDINDAWKKSYNTYSLLICVQK